METGHGTIILNKLGSDSEEIGRTTLLPCIQVKQH